MTKSYIYIQKTATMKNRIILLLLLPFALATCKDKEPQYLGEFKLGPEGEAYIKFEPGSYWIYQNSVTAAKDTITMTTYRSKILFFDGELRSYYREDIRYTMKGNSGNYITINEHPYVDATPENLHKEGVELFSMNTSKVSIGATTSFYYPFSMPSGGTISGQSSYLIKQHDSLQVQGKWYYTVAEFEVDNDWMYSTKETNHTKYYWAKNVGLIRRVLLEERSIDEVESWDIIEYNVTQ